MRFEVLNDEYEDYSLLGYGTMAYKFPYFGGIFA
jgi:hypothetical protein